MALGFMYRLEHPDGTPADPPTMRSAVPTWKAGDMIPLGGRTLRVIDTRPADEPDGEPVLVVEHSVPSAAP